MQFSIGTYISFIAHAVLLVWLLVEGRFNSSADAIPLEIAQVSVISAEVFDVMQNNTPPTVDIEDTALAQPQTPDIAPEITQLQEDTAVAAPQIETVAPPTAPDALPNLPEQAPNLFTDPPSIDTLAPPVDAPTEEQPSLQSVDRVAAQAVAPSAPDIAIDDVARTATMPNIEAAEPAPVETETTAPKAATTQIVTEADETAPQITAAPRPPARPAPVAPVEVADTAPEPEPVDNSGATQAAIDDLFAGLDLGAAEEAPAAPVALTASEVAGLRLAISQCWNLGALSSSAMSTTVLVAFEMNEDARPIAGSITMTGYTGGSEDDADKAFIAAKDAILACGGRGYNLPQDKFELWRNIVLTFNPENMRRR